MAPWLGWFLCQMSRLLAPKLEAERYNLLFSSNSELSKIRLSPKFELPDTSVGPRRLLHDVSCLRRGGQILIWRVNYGCVAAVEGRQRAPRTRSCWEPRKVAQNTEWTSTDGINFVAKRWMPLSFFGGELDISMHILPLVITFSATECLFKDRTAR